MRGRIKGRRQLGQPLGQTRPQATNQQGRVEGQQALAHQLAYLLPLSQEQKLELLEEADAAQRLARIQTFLSALQGELIA